MMNNLKTIFRFMVLAISIALLLPDKAISEMSLKEIDLTKELEGQYDFSVNYEINYYENLFVVAVFPDSIGPNYRASSSIITIKLKSGGFVSFKNNVGRGEKSHKTEVAFENEKDFLDASVSIVYRCRTKEGVVCQGRSYTVGSIRQRQAN